MRKEAKLKKGSPQVPGLDSWEGPEIVGMKNIKGRSRVSQGIW